MSFIADLLNESTREAALLELSKKREQVPELALILWHSFGASCLPQPSPAMPRSAGRADVLTLTLHQAS